MELLKATKNYNSTTYKDPHNKNNEFTRDLICLWLGEKSDWELKVNGELISGLGWIELGKTLKELVRLKEKSHRKKSIRRLVIWVNRLAVFHKVLSLALNETLKARTINNQKSFNKDALLWMSNDHIEFRSFDMVAGENAKRIKQTFGYEGNEVDAMESYINAQEEHNWARFRWTAAHCFEAQFYKRLDQRFKDNERKEFNYEIITRKENNIYNNFIYNGGKAGIIWVNDSTKRKVLENVISYDISQAYGGQFVRANDFPLGSIRSTNIPKEEVMKEKWYAFVFEFNHKVTPPVPWIEVFEKTGKWFCLVTKPDLDCMKLMGAKFREQPRIRYQFICKKVGYLNFRVRELINDLYNERQKLKAEGDKTEKFLKQMNEVIYGKGLQDRSKDSNGDEQVNFRYFCPQISYHALAKTRLELVTMMSRLKDCLVACDSDSIKVAKHTYANELFEERNEEIRTELAAAGFTNTKIGTWKYEGTYSRFVQFEKKVYAYEDQGELVCKFAGCNREQLIKWLQEGRDMNDLMKSMKIPCGVLQKEIRYNINGNYWVETKYYDYSLDEKGMSAFMKRRQIIRNVC